MVTERDEAKWASLLQPIKQLEKNWDIDIAAELADYLEELSVLTFEVNGRKNLDFAEAALVVHSSSCTYGKKVDYLMKLTLAALESSKAKQQENTPASRKRRVRSAKHGMRCLRAPALTAQVCCLRIAVWPRTCDTLVRAGPRGPGRGGFQDTSRPHSRHCISRMWGQQPGQSNLWCS